MFGSYVEVLAALNIPSGSNNSCIESFSTKKDAFSSLFPKTEANIFQNIFCSNFFQLKESDVDFVLIAEFCENQGPSLVFTIPNDLHTRIDLNAYVLQILASDHQNVSNSRFSGSNDVQLLLSDHNEGIHSFVHYFTLFDFDARGYVRPMCMAYVSRDLMKLIDNFSFLKDAMSEISKIMKHSNKGFFEQELENHLCNLQRSHETVFHNGNYSPSKACYQEKNSSESKQKQKCRTHLVGFQKEIDEIHHCIKNKSVDSTVDEILNFVEALAISSISRESFYRLWPRHQKSKSCRNNVAQKLQQMKTIFDLCTWGAVLAVLLLLKIQRIFSKNGILLYLEGEDQILETPVDGVLSIGHNLLLNILPKESKLRQRNHVSFFKKDELLTWIKNYFLSSVHSQELKRIFDVIIHCDASLNSCVEYVDISENAKSLFKSSPSRKCDLSNLQIRLNQGPEDDTSSVCKLKNKETLPKFNSFIKYVQHITPDKPGYGISRIFSKFYCFRHLLYSLLIGRLVVVVGNPSAEDEVRNVIQALAVFIPEKTGREAVLPWSNKKLSLQEIIRYKLVGLNSHNFRKLSDINYMQNYISILDINTRIYRGVVYNDKLLSHLVPFFSCMVNDSFLVTHIFCLLISLCNQVLIHYHSSIIDESLESNSSLQTTNGCEFLDEINLGIQDKEIIKSFVDLLRRKQVQKFQLENGYEFTDGNSFLRLFHNQPVEEIL